MTTGRINQVARPTRQHAPSRRIFAARLRFAVPSLPHGQREGHHHATESRHATSSSSATLQPPPCQAGFAEAHCRILAACRGSAAPTWQVVALGPATPTTTSHPRVDTRAEACTAAFLARATTDHSHNQTRPACTGFHHARCHGLTRGSRVATVNCTTTAPPS